MTKVSHRQPPWSSAAGRKRLPPKRITGTTSRLPFAPHRETVRSETQIVTAFDSGHQVSVGLTGTVQQRVLAIDTGLESLVERQPNDDSPGRSRPGRHLLATLHQPHPARSKCALAERASCLRDARTQQQSQRLGVAGFDISPEEKKGLRLADRGRHGKTGGPSPI